MIFFNVLREPQDDNAFTLILYKVCQAEALEAFYS